MKTHEFKTEKGEFVVVDNDDPNVTENLYKYCQKNGTLLPMFSIKKATEEDASSVVDMYNIGNFNILSYKPSLEYLLTSKGIDINNGNWYLFKKV